VYNVCTVLCVRACVYNNIAAVRLLIMVVSLDQLARDHCNYKLTSAMLTMVTGSVCMYVCAHIHGA